MEYTIKAIPTRYAGVNFRSRLEARWAAFFDLAKIEWEYEPFDLDGWAPDFLLRLGTCSALVEVKPVDLTGIMDASISNGEDSIDLRQYKKARLHAGKNNVLLLGNSPFMDRTGFPIGVPIGSTGNETDAPDEVYHALHVERSDILWREAGNLVQWQPSNDNNQSVNAIVARAVKKASR